MIIFNAMKLYRLSNFFYKKNYKKFSYLIDRVNNLLKNSHIPGSCTIGKNTKFAYGGIGIVIHDDAKIGSNCIIGQGITIGGNRLGENPPIIEDNVYLAAGARIIGNIRIGHDSIVAPNSVVVSNVESYSIYSGIPAKKIITIDENNIYKYKSYGISGYSKSNYDNNVKKVGIVFGTRPEAIKVAPVYHELKNNGIDVKAVVTGQHKEMLYQVLDLFEIKPDYDLKIMKQGQGLSELTGRLMLKLDEIMKKEKFDYVLVQGDTTSVLTGALSAFYNQILVGHIEAGLRTGNIYSPFPEEANRKLVGTITDIHFAPTDVNVENLLKEGYPKEKILKVGNTVIDALYWVKQNKQKDLEEIKKKYGIENKKYILLTMHRRENWGKPMEETLRAVRDYLERHKDLYLVFPMHLNPLVREVAHKVLDSLERKILIEPLEYLEFIAVMDGAHYIMTDSGGVQEEAPSLGKPTLVLRDTTERPEAIEAGTAKLVGTRYDEVIKYMELLEGELYQEMSKANNPYGDGKTSQRIREYLQSI